MTPWLANAVMIADISWRLLLGVIGAESDYALRAEHWGKRTDEALIALTARDDAKLRHIIATEWPDISFGLSQRIILYHYHGDRTPTLDNVLAVRQYVFTHPDIDLVEMARNLAWRRDAIVAGDRDLSRVNGDVDLATAISYNRGSYPANGHSYWTVYAGNVARFEASFAAVDSKLPDNVTNLPAQLIPNRGP